MTSRTALSLAGEQLVGERVRVDQGAPGGVDEDAAVPDQRESAAVEHAVGLGDVGGVEADDVAGAQQVPQCHRLGAQRGGPRRVDVRVVERDGEVERLQQFQKPAADPRGPDDPDPAAHVADGRGLGGEG